MSGQSFMCVSPWFSALRYLTCFKIKYSLVRTVDALEPPRRCFSPGAPLTIAFSLRWLPSSAFSPLRRRDGRHLFYPPQGLLEGAEDGRDSRIRPIDISAEGIVPEAFANLSV